MTIIAELSTNHGGDVDLACDMVKAAADAGATYAKIQTYDLSRLNPSDPQKDWLTRAHLDEAAHVRVMAACEQAGIMFLSTPFDAGSLAMLRRLGVKEFKIASSESGNRWWEPELSERWFVSYPWGVKTIHLTHDNYLSPHYVALTAIPLYPTPLEAVSRAPLLRGWSDHTMGLSACRWAIVQGAEAIEAHLCLPGRGRESVWDKTPEQFRQLRDFADDCATMTSGVATKFRNRWGGAA